MHDRFIDMENAERIIRKWAHRAGFLLVRKRKSSTRRTLMYVYVLCVCVAVNLDRNDVMIIML